MRAILTEEIPQSWVGIWFCENEIADNNDQQIKNNQRKYNFQTSTINMLRVDSNGRIMNWPKGFLDDDLKEAELLMQVMYGRKSK